MKSGEKVKGGVNGSKFSQDQGDEMALTCWALQKDSRFGQKFIL